ncbi:ABC transporter substrate-binding protein [Rhodococcus sp. NPDC057014]|uniref:ABC transporter substrate-binding protein n=1 Tax=Rhodococcus sp. NPDC057014 TaxID=3346000 RepID=UPI003625EBAF
MDTAKSRGEDEVVYYKLFYGTLLRQSRDGVFTPWMAKGVEVIDPHTVKIALREGVRFSDGAAFDAEAVRTSLLRARSPLTPTAQAVLAPGLRQVDVVEVIDPLTAVVKLSQPLAGQFYVELSSVAGAIMSPKQIAANPDQIDTMPVGAGPFTVTENKPGQRLSVRKNPDYWDADNVHLAGVDIINTPTGPQHANGLLSGKLDWASYVSVNSAEAIDANDKFATEISNVYNIYLNMCTAESPFNNEKFRKAVQVGIDRERFSKLVYGGLAEPAYSLLPEDSAAFDPDLKKSIEYDPERSKQLVAESGVTAPISLHYPATLNFGVESETLQAQFARLGVHVDITSDRDVMAGFIVPKKPGALLSFYSGSRTFRQFDTYFGPGSPMALCGVDRPDIMEAVRTAASVTPGDPTAIASYQAAAKLIAESAYLIPVVTYPNVQGWNTDRVEGNPTFDAFGLLNIDSLHIKK